MFPETMDPSLPMQGATDGRNAISKQCDAPNVRATPTQASDRKLRLFGVACCRRLRRRLLERPVVRALDLAEQYCEGTASRTELETAHTAAERMWRDTPLGIRREVAEAAAWTLFPMAAQGAEYASAAAARVAGYEPGEEAGWSHAVQQVEREERSKLLRCITNPFHPWTIQPSLRTDSIRNLATAIDAERAWDRLPILADALEEAGVRDGDALTHARSGGPHARGCWLLDGILGMS